MFGKKRSKKIKYIIAGLFIGGVLLVFWYVMGLIFTEDLYTKKGTLPYYLLIHAEIIKGFPQIKKLGEETYYSSAGDGPKPPATGVMYQSEEQPEVLMKILDEYVLSKGYVKDEKETSGNYLYHIKKNSFYYTKENSSFELSITTNSEGIQEISAIENY